MTSRTRIDLAVFAALTLLISGGLWLILGLLGANVREGAALWVFGVAAAGPSLAALVLFLVRRRGERQRVSAAWLWAPAAVLLGVAPTVIASLVVTPGDAPGLVAAAPSVVDGMGGVLMFVVLFLIAGPIAEEFGWRGYMQPRLRRSRGLIATSVILGIAWALWHVPLFFLPGTGQSEIGLFTLNGLLFMLSFVPLSLVYLFVSERLGGRVWAAILIHFSGNAIGAFVPGETPAHAAVQLLATTLIAGVLYLAWSPAERGPLAGVASAGAPLVPDRVRA